MTATRPRPPGVSSPRAPGVSSPRAPGVSPPRAPGATPPRAPGATPPRAPGATTLGRAAPWLFLMLWSSSFLGTRIGLRHMTPLLFVAIRMVLAAVVLLAIMTIARRPKAMSPWGLTPMAWFHCAVAGVLTQAILLMASHVAMVRSEAAPIALIQTLNPLLTALLAWPLLKERLRASQIVGLGLGFAGVLLVLGRAALASRAELPGLLGATAGVGALVAGTLYYRHFCRAIPPLAGATVQTIAGAVVCSGTAAVLETPWTDADPAIVFAIGWNAIVISIGGMGLYFMMLARGTAARATVNFYLVPGITALLTWAFLGERLTLVTFAGLAISGIGCWLVGRGPA